MSCGQAISTSRAVNPYVRAQLLRCYGVPGSDQGVCTTRRMEVSALKYSGGIGLHGRSPLLRLQSDERLIAYMRQGNTAAFEVLVSRYETRLLAFCRHLLGSREDAEDVLQEVMTAAFNAILADERPINVRPWLYRIARNRSLNHLRRAQAIGVDSMDTHFSDHGASTADKVHEREEFRLLVGDIHELPETQKTALVLREMDALSYEQIAEAMETTRAQRQVAARARAGIAGRGGRGPPAVLRRGADRARRGGRGAEAPPQPAGPPPPAQLQALHDVPRAAQADQQGAGRADADRAARGPQEAGHLPSRPLGGQRRGLERDRGRFGRRAPPGPAARGAGAEWARRSRGRQRPGRSDLRRGLGRLHLRRPGRDRHQGGGRPGRGRPGHRGRGGGRPQRPGAVTTRATPWPRSPRRPARPIRPPSPRVATHAEPRSSAASAPRRTHRSEPIAAQDAANAKTTSTAGQDAPRRHDAGTGHRDQDAGAAARPPPGRTQTQTDPTVLQPTASTRPVRSGTTLHRRRRVRSRAVARPRPARARRRRELLRARAPPRRPARRQRPPPRRRRPDRPPPPGDRPPPPSSSPPPPQ